MPKGVKDSATHGGSGTLYNNGCRCKPCVLAHRQRMLVLREKRRAERKWVDGQLVAVNAKTHGSASTYSNWGCRCIPCMKAQSDKNRKTHARRQGSQSAGVAALVEQGGE